MEGRKSEIGGVSSFEGKPGVRVRVGRVLEVFVGAKEEESASKKLGKC